MRGTWLHRKLGDRLFAREMWQPERGRFAFGCAIGVFFAMMPVPFQMVAAALIAFLVRVNIPAAVACTWVSNPLTTPLILFSQYYLGSFVLGRDGNRSAEGGHACAARASAMAAPGGGAHLGDDSLDREPIRSPWRVGIG